MKQAEYQEHQQWLHKIYEKNEPMLTLITCTAIKKVFMLAWTTYYVSVFLHG